ncbi:hypothetical protein MLD38_017836 [Melastoma candidum]|uniref:Uncharacterized protein n=1 Tax=Melastoma candidum TaxID=119954 RepID=A0ACB9QVF9_9MYRT|nr:hypothetical protein MLD38_017836 [Melastoma candidum]
MGCGVLIFFMNIAFFFIPSFHGFFRSLHQCQGGNAESLAVERIRGLLESRTSSKTRGYYAFPFPSQAPAPGPALALAPAPAPAPVFAHAMSPHRHHHHPLTHQRESPQQGDIRRGHDGDTKRKLVAAIVPAGIVFLLACVLGVVWFFGKCRGRGGRVAQFCGKNRSRRNRSRYAARRSMGSKVTSNPGIDLFYLNSLGIDLERQTSRLQCDSALVTNSDLSMFVEDAARAEQSRAESSDLSTSSTKEIVSVHEDAESLKCDRVSGSSGHSCLDNKFPMTESAASDDDSYHSLRDSISQSCRFSDALDCDIPEVPEVKCPLLLNPQGIQGSASSPLPPPTPPPPPPPAARAALRLNIRISRTTPTLPATSYLSRNSISSLKSEQKPVPTPPSPPPPPPPPRKGNVGSIKTPPPLPGHFPCFAAGEMDGGADLPKLKPLHWDKVRATPDRCTVWDKLRSSSFELDEEMIGSLFSYNLRSALKNDESKSKTPSPSNHMLEPKRLQNLTILSKAINMSGDEVCHALLQGSGLSQQQLEALVKMAPTEEEVAKLNGYTGDINELASAEKFVKTLLGIPFAFERAEAMLYKETFEDEIVHLRNSFSMLEEACKELRSSRLFLKLLEAVLKTGNRMNVGTIRGGATAFKLDALLKLADVKGTDGKTTLLHFVVQEMVRSEGIRVSGSIMGTIDQRSKIPRTLEDKEEDYRRMGLDLVSGLCTELYNVKKTATVDLQVLVSSVSNLWDGMTRLESLIDRDAVIKEHPDNFIHSMRTFLSHSRERLSELQEDERKVMLHVRGVTEYFHGDASKEEASPLRIFVIVRDFLGMLDHVCKELRCVRVPGSPSPLAPFR